MKKLLATALAITMLLSMAVVAAVPAAAVDGDWTVMGSIGAFFDDYEGEPYCVPGYEYTDEGLQTIDPDWRDEVPNVRVRTTNKVDLKEGVYVQFRVDEFSYTGDKWFNVNIWDGPYISPGSKNTERYGSGIQTLIRPGDAAEGKHGAISGITWYKEGFDGAGSSSMAADAQKTDAEGRPLVTLTITWDGSTYAVDINGAKAPQAAIDWMNAKWGGNDSEAYIGFVLHHTTKNGKMKMTITKFGTSAEDATTPLGDDKAEPVTEYHTIADIADPSTVPAGQPAIFMNGSRDESDSKSNHGITAGGDSKRNEDFSVRYSPKQAQLQASYAVANDVSYDGKDFPVMLVLTRDYCTCEDPADCYALESVNTYICNGEITGADEQHKISELNMCDSVIVKDGRNYLYFYADLENDAGFDYEGRINQVRIDFNGVMFDTAGRNAFDIVFIAYFRNVEEAEQYVYDYLGVTEETTAEPTEAPTEETTEAPTEEATTEAPKADATTEAPAADNETDAPAEGGCGSVVGFGAIAIVAVAA
ncbi:MAG: hypothetical protein IJY39_06735, partial [Clostridia bacterium]|nr:hypothetical protein [Clostridia bacterium]